MDAAAEIDAVGAVIDLDQHRERVAGASLLAHGLRHPFGRLAAHFARYQRAVEAEGGGELGRVAGDEAAAEHLLGARQMGDAGGDLAGGEGLDHRQRTLAGGECREHDAFERLVVLAEDEVAEPLAHLGLHRSELPMDLAHIGAAHGQLGLDLRVMGAKAELDAAVGDEIFDPGQQLIDMRLAEPIGMKALQVDDTSARRRAPGGAG